MDVVRAMAGKAKFDSCITRGCGRSDVMALGLCTKHHHQKRAGKSIDVAIEPVAAPPVVTPKKRCQWVTVKGERCVRARAGAGKYCNAHRAEFEDARLSSRHDWEIVLPDRTERWEYEGQESELTDAPEK